MREPLTGPERLALKATVVRWERDRMPRDARQLADAFGALMAEWDRLAEQVEHLKKLTHDSDGGLLPPESELPVGVFYGVLYGDQEASRS